MANRKTLTQEQTCKVYDWLRKNKKQLLDMRLTSESASRECTAAVGFPVGPTTVKRIGITAKIRWFGERISYKRKCNSNGEDMKAVCETINVILAEITRTTGTEIRPPAEFIRLYDKYMNPNGQQLPNAKREPF